MIDLTDPIFRDEDKAREHFEAIRWPNGPICPHCGSVKDLKRLEGKSHRPGLFQCNACREHFTVQVGSVMEASHIPLTKWALGFHLMAASKKGVSAHQLWRMLGLGSYKSAWFMGHRIREAMKMGGDPLGGSGKTVEADSTYYGTDKSKPRKPRSNKRSVLALVERGGPMRAFHMPDTRHKTLQAVMAQNVAPDSHLRTDGDPIFNWVGYDYLSHKTVIHSAGEYARGDAHTNSAEAFFNVFKRGMRGIYQQCGHQHLQRYLTEFSFRYSHRIAVGVDDTERTRRAIKGADGRRLTYKRTRQAP